MDLLPRQRPVGRPAALVALLLALLAPSAAPAASSREAAALPGGFGVRPVVPKGKDRPPSYFIIDAGPGSIAERSVVVINGTKKTKHLIVDGVDGLTGQTTGVVYSNRGDRHREASLWVRPGKHRIQVAPGSTRRLRFLVKVPQNVRGGDHLAGLAFEDAHTSTTKSRFAVKQIVRVVVGVQVHVRGGTQPQGTVGLTALEAQPGTQVATAVVHLANDGDRLCHPRLKVILQPQDGASRTVEKQLDTVLPHDAIDYPMAFPGQLPAGSYGAEAKLSGCGTDRTAAATLVLGKTLNGSSPRAGHHASQHDDGTPSWIPIAAFVLLGMGGGIAGLLTVQQVQRRRGGQAA